MHVLLDLQPVSDHLQRDSTETTKRALKTEPSRMYRLYILLQRKEQVMDPRSVLDGA